MRWLKRSGIAEAAAQIQFLAWELLYAAGAAIKTYKQKPVFLTYAAYDFKLLARREAGNAL